MAIAKGNAVGNMNLPIEEYRRFFKYIISKEDPINITINNLYKKYKGNAFLPYFTGQSGLNKPNSKGRLFTINCLKTSQIHC